MSNREYSYNNGGDVAVAAALSATTLDCIALHTVSVYCVRSVRMNERNETNEVAKEIEKFASKG